MPPKSETITTKPVNAAGPEKLMQLGMAFWGSKVFLSAVELGIFTLLARQPMDADALEKSLGLHKRASKDFLDCLVSLGLLERTDGIYSNTTETATYLDSTKPAYIGGFFEMVNNRLYSSWGGLTTALKNGTARNDSESKADLFEILYNNPQNLKIFLQAMTGISRSCVSAIAEKFPWQKYNSFVDVGTAQGGLAVEIAKRHPHLTGTGYDLPQCKPIFESFAKEHQVDKQLTFKSGDFFKDDLPSADVLVMGHILHDWNLEQKRMLIAKAYKALAPGGAYLVYEAMIDNERKENTLGLLMSLNMLMETLGGFDFTPAQLEEWLREAGFKDVSFTKLTPTHTMAVAIK